MFLEYFQLLIEKLTRSYNHRAEWNVEAIFQGANRPGWLVS